MNFKRTSAISCTHKFETLIGMETTATGERREGSTLEVPRETFRDSYGGRQPSVKHV